MNTSPNRVLRRVWDRLVSCMEPGGLTKALLISGAFLASTTADATDFWFSPPGWSGSTTTSITGTSSSVPYAYPTSPSGTTRDKVGSRATAFATTLGEVLGGAYSGSSTNVTLNFIPGVYPVTPILPTSGWLGTTNFSQMTNTVLTIQNGWGVTTNTATVKLQLVADMDPGQANWENTNYNNAWGNRFANLGILNTHSGTSYYDPQYFIPYARFVAQNLIFDCNWDGLGGWTAPSHNGFKTFGLTASGRTGKILNVKVVNAGASGPVPATQDMFSGSEGFPLSVFASDFFQDPFTGSGDPTAWVVDSCEVTDFHSSHGGYAAGITVTPRFPGLSGTDVVVGLKGGESKLDASLQSSYGGATYWFEVLDQSTYKNRRIATVQNCFANLIGSAFGVANGGAVRFEGNVVVNGTGLNSDTGHTRNVEVTNSVFLDVLMGANVGSWSPTSGTAYFQNWKFNGNLIRIDRRSALWDYRNYEYNSDNAALVGRDPSALPLWGTNYICYAFAFGSCNTMDVQTNRVTTRPRAAFFEPNPSDTSSATFTVVYRPNIDPLLHHTVDQTQSEPNTNGLVLSGVAYDFGSYSAMNSSSLLYSNTLAIANGPTDIATNGFFGRVQRVERVTSSGKLTGIKEVALSTPIAGSGGNYTVQGRWTLQPTPADTGHSGTTALAPTNVQFLVQDAASNTVSLSAPSTSGNISTLTLPSSLSDGYYHIVAYVLASGATTFDPTRDAWSETEYLKGTTVRFLTSQDMANDRRPSRGSMVIGRTGVTTNSLTVKIKQLTGIGRDAVYNTDFIVESNGVTNSQNGDSTFSITIPTGSNWITVDLMPIKDSQLEREAAVFYITNNAGSYSIAPSFDWPGFPPQRAAARPDLYSNSEWRFSSSVYFYDGPLWEAVSLNDTPTSNYAFVNGTVGRITDESNP
ncbi:MAG TPA: hypothetical protein VMF06_15470, partial [Candidatus Limnocylindria bacterium]|nr:hypothetical protein [Candidatus Limnocylindria bacterium]